VRPTIDGRYVGLQDLYGKIPRVRVPKIKWGGLTSRRVLTMEFIQGCKLTDRVAMAQNGELFWNAMRRCRR